jgi:beta-N-acetylhexosaminidase
MVDLAGFELADQERDMLHHPQVGGVILFTRNFASMNQISQLVNAIHAVRDPQLLVAVDQEGGQVQRFREGFMRIPPAQRFGAHYDQNPKQAQALAETAGWIIAVELRAIAVDFSFTPVLDLSHGISGVIGDRAYHRSPEVVADLAHHVMLGMRRAGMQAVAKHFPGHGAVREDSHEQLPIDGRRVVDIMSDDLLPFERMIHYGLSGIMPAHVIYTQADSQPAGYSSFWLKTVLRKQLGFQGAIFSDDLNMAAAHGVGSCAERAKAALEAGCDMVLICNDPTGANNALEALEGYDNPASQLRLARFHGHRRLNYTDLRMSQEWQSAVRTIQSFSDNPSNLELNV